MIERGVFVELKESRAEGLIPFKAFDEHFVVDEGRYKAVDKRTGTVIKRGDRIKVKLLEINLGARQIELEPIELMEK
jgi:ribonuclease R